MESGPRSCGGDGGPEGAEVAEVGPSWPSIGGGKRAKAIQDGNGKFFTPAFSSPPLSGERLGLFYTDDGGAYKDVLVISPCEKNSKI